MRSRIITKAITSSGSIPGCTIRVNTSLLNTRVAFTVFLDILATTSPVAPLVILQLRRPNDPSILKSGGAVWLLSSMWISASDALVWIRFEEGLLIVNSLDGVAFFEQSSSPLYPFHWFFMLNACTQILRVNFGFLDLVNQHAHEWIYALMYIPLVSPSIEASPIRPWEAVRQQRRNTYFWRNSPPGKPICRGDQKL